MIVLALDVSTKTGYSLMDHDFNLLEFGQLEEKVEDYIVKDPTSSKLYPFNFVDVANKMGAKIIQLLENKKYDYVVIENTVKGRNRASQRILEFLHKVVLDWFNRDDRKVLLKYIDPSAWRKELGIRLSKEEKKKNALVNKGKARGKITKKHLAVNFVNARFNLKFKLKDNNKADAICLNECGIRIFNKAIDT